MMPGMDGLDLARHIRASRLIAGLRLVLLTSAGRPDEMRTAALPRYLRLPDQARAAVGAFQRLMKDHDTVGPAPDRGSTIPSERFS